MMSASNVVEVICAGSAKEMGLAQGAGLKDRIHGARQVLHELEAFRLQQPWWLPYSGYRWLAEQKASRFLTRALDRDRPNLSQRLAGIAEGAGIGLRTIHLFNALEPVLSSVGGCTACPGACSAVAVRGSRSITGEPMVARNFDYLPFNAFSSDRMREVQIPWNAVYTDHAPTPLRGRRLHLSSQLRDQRFKELLGPSGPLGANELGAIMADHGPTGTPDSNTPCIHSAYWNTTACLQFFPKSRRIRVSYSNACQARYQEAEL